MTQELINKFESMGFVKTDKSVNDSLVLYCDFMQVPNTEIYISDYDIRGQKECLETRDLFCVFNLEKHKFNYTFISHSKFFIIYFKESLKKNDDLTYKHIKNNMSMLESVMRELLK